MTESEAGQVINGYRWDGSQWTPIPGQVVDGYEWDGTQWTPVSGQVVDGYRWDGSQWVPAAGESVEDSRWDRTGWVEEPPPAAAPVAAAQPTPVRPLTKRRGFWVTVVALLGLGLLMLRVAPVYEPVISTTTPPATTTTTASTAAGTGEVVQMRVGDGPDAMAVDPAAGRVYVGNSGTDGNSGSDGFSVSVIEEPQVVATIPLDYAQPIGLALDPGATALYVSDPGGGLTVVDTATLTVRDKSHLGSGGTLAIDPAKRTLYIAQYEQGTVAVVHLTDMSAGTAIDVGNAPTGVAIDPEAQRLYVSISESSNADYAIAVVDTAKGSVVDSIPIGHQPFGLALDASEQRLYVSDPAGGVSVIDLRTKRVVGSIPTTGQTLGIAVNPVARELYVADYASDTVVILPLD